MIYNKKSMFLNLSPAFSLMELMVVICIVGILSSIAIPNYQNYLSRAKVTQMIAMMDPCQVYIYQKYVADGSFPTSIFCQGFTLSNTAATYTEIPNSQISIKYSITAGTSSESIAILHITNLGVKENSVVCELQLELREILDSDNKLIDVTKTCKVNNCSSVNVFPNNCLTESNN